MSIDMERTIDTAYAKPFIKPPDGIRIPSYTLAVPMVDSEMDALMNSDSGTRIRSESGLIVIDPWTLCWEFRIKWESNPSGDTFMQLRR